MANLASPLTTYSDTTPHTRVINDFITMIDPHDSAAIDALGGLDGASSKFRFQNWPGYKCEWLEDTLGPLTDVLNEDATITSTATTLTTTDPNIFQEGHIVKVDAELMWVSGVSSTTLTVTRNYGGTQASHDSIAAIEIVGMARLEGDDSDDIGFTDVTAGYNYTQIFHKEIKVSRTQRQINQYGKQDEFDYQVSKAVPELTRLIEKNFYNGVRGAGSSSTPRGFGGYSTFITDNKVSGATWATSVITNALKAAYSDGGSGPWYAFCSPSSLQAITALYDNSAFLRVDRTEETMGMVIQSVLTPFGQVHLVLDRWAPTTVVPLVDAKHAGFATLQPFTVEELAKTGDADKSEVVGEFTFCCKADKAHALITAVTTT